MPKERALLLIALCLALAGVARAEDWSAWQRAYDPATRTRFIPVELWTGAPWDGTQEIRMAPAALEFGRRGDKSIKGPTTWNGIQVYERLNRDKLQRFAIRDDRTGLGRVFDSRYPQLGCRGEVKFPLGRWKQGEVREYQLDCARGKRPLKVTIEEIDFVYDGVPHSLRFHWLFMEGRGRGTDMRYVYSPLRGLVDVQGNESLETWTFDWTICVDPRFGPCSRSIFETCTRFLRRRACMPLTWTPCATRASRSGLPGPEATCWGVAH